MISIRKSWKRRVSTHGDGKDARIVSFDFAVRPEVLEGGMAAQDRIRLGLSV
jgi:hypothetical protein